MRHSFPTRRSSDLVGGAKLLSVLPSGVPYRGRAGGRSEEHTSELQSPLNISYAVFCLKKKNAPAQTFWLHACLDEAPRAALRGLAREGIWRLNLRPILSARRWPFFFLMIRRPPRFTR